MSRQPHLPSSWPGTVKKCVGMRRGRSPYSAQGQAQDLRCKHGTGHSQRNGIRSMGASYSSALRADLLVGLPERVVVLDDPLAHAVIHRSARSLRGAGGPKRLGSRNQRRELGRCLLARADPLTRSSSFIRFERAARRIRSKASSTSRPYRSAMIPFACSMPIRDSRACSSWARRSYDAWVTESSRATAADASCERPDLDVPLRQGRPV